jgi:hypothetical protein
MSATAYERVIDTAYAAPPNEFNTAHAAAFLSAVFQDCHSGQISISRLGRDGKSAGHYSHRWAHEVACVARDWDRDKPRGIYFRVTMLPPAWRRSGRGGANDSHMFPMLWADLDFGGVGHKPPKDGALPPTEDDARKIITDMGEEPTYVVHSGGGLYPLWQFERPPMITADNLAEVKATADQWQQLTAQASARLGYHYGQQRDLSRVLRLPGSINRKTDYERPCRVTEASRVLYPWG